MMNWNRKKYERKMLGGNNVCENYFFQKSAVGFNWKLHLHVLWNVKYKKKTGIFESVLFVEGKRVIKQNRCVYNGILNMYIYK